MIDKQQITNRRQQRIAIVAGLRTPFAKQATAFKNIPAVELGTMVVNELINRTCLDPKLIDLLVFGQVIQMPEAPNIAREIVLGSQMSVNTDAYSVSRACTTSFQTTINVIESIMAGHCEIGIAGGADSASVLPITVSKSLASILVDLTKTKKLSQKLSLLTQLTLTDFLPVSPAICEYSTALSMGETAEQMAKSHKISRQDQDEFAHRSHLLAQKAWQKALLSDEVMTAHVPTYLSYIDKDNGIRENSILDAYSQLNPIFDKKFGSVTAGNSSPLTDGGSAVLLMSEDKAKSLGYTPLGYIKSYAGTAIDVWQDMLMGPAYATPMALARAGLELENITLIEMHEAFSAQVLANINRFASTHFAEKHLGRNRAIGDIDMNKFNINGGSIAYGHPFAATGTRLLTQICYELKRQGGGFGLVTACAAGGLGSAIIVEVE